MKSPLGFVIKGKEEGGSYQRNKRTRNSAGFAPQSPIAPPANRNYRGWGVLSVEGFLVQSMIGFAV